MFLSGTGSPGVCGECLQNPPPFTCHRSAGRYSGLLKDLIALFKYEGLEPLGCDLARFAWAALSLESKLWDGVEAVLPVPLHRRRLKSRGFNQAAVLAREMEKLAGLRSSNVRLMRLKDIPAQIGLAGGARRRNVRGAFGLRRAENLAGRTFLLVDDVYTTGSTVTECCRVLKRGGAAEVRVLTLARAQD